MEKTQDLFTSSPRSWETNSTDTTHIFQVYAKTVQGIRSYVKREEAETTATTRERQRQTTDFNVQSSIFLLYQGIQSTIFLLYQGIQSTISCYIRAKHILSKFNYEIECINKG